MDRGVDTGQLATVVGDALGVGDVEIRDLRRLTGGASRESWSFDAVGDGGRHELILRRAPDTAQGARTSGDLMLLEAAAMREANRVGVPGPEVLAAGAGTQVLGAPFIVMRRVAGETIARRILREEAYAGARTRFAEQCGAILGGVHAMDSGAVAGVPDLDPLDALRAIFDETRIVSPTLELAFRWLAAHRYPPKRKVVVHGDFRLGNLVLDRDGIAAVLDWELVHLGDPMEDLGWLCMRAWRFGGGAPVAGVGSYDQLFDSYEHASGQPVERAAVKWWELYATVRWGVMCVVQANRHLSGAERSLELLAIGRRLCEQEYDALRLLEEVRR